MAMFLIGFRSRFKCFLTLNEKQPPPQLAEMNGRAPLSAKPPRAAAPRPRLFGAPVLFDARGVFPLLKIFDNTHLRRVVRRPFLAVSKNRLHPANSVAPLRLKFLLNFR
jgi:hypothetical protein